MELNPAFKQSEMGLIPADWEEIHLGSKTLKVGSGITPTGGARIYLQSGRPFVRSQNVGWGKLIIDDLVYIDERTHRSFEGTELRPNDVLLNITGASIGRCAVADERVASGNVNQHVCIIRTNSNDLDPNFLKYYLLSSSGQNQIDSFQAGGSRQGLNFGQIRSFRLAAPMDVREQRAIAAALSDVDGLINSLTALIAKKRDIKRATMQQLLTGKIRLPGFSGEWEEKRLGNLAPLQRGFDLPTKMLRPGRYPVVYSNGILNYHSRFQVKGPGVITGRSGTIGTVTYTEDDFWPHNTSLWVTSFGRNSPKFVYYFYTFIDLAQFSTGSGVPTLNRNDVHAFEVKVPPTSDEQSAIAAVLTDLDVELAAIDAKREKGRSQARYDAGVADRKD
jgi:type I restriction enzyme S subunit